MFVRKVFVFMATLSFLKAYTVYSTDFENCTDSTPPGWILYDMNGDGHYFAAINYSTYAHSGSWYIRYNSRSASVEGDDWAISDTFTLTGNQNDTLEFYQRVQSSWYYEKLRVYLLDGNGPDDTVMLLWRVDTLDNTSYTLRRVIFKVPYSGVYRLGFFSNSDPHGRNVKVDDVSLKAPDISRNNLAIDRVSPFYQGWVTDSCIKADSTGGGIFTVVVKNYGNHDFHNTKTRYKIDSAGVTIVPETEIGHDNINAGQVKTYTFTFYPSIYHMAEYDIYVYHDKVTDPNNTYHEDDTFHMHFIVRGHQGKEGYGWVFRDSRSIFGAPGNTQWIELNGDGSAEDLNLNDEGSVMRALAGSIRFYGHDYDSIYIDPNGIISFDHEPNGNNFENDSIPSSSASMAVMPFWDDLDPGSGGKVYYRTFSDTLTVIEWYRVPRYNTDSLLTFEVQIQSNQASSGIYDNVTFLYYNMQYYEYAMDATIGIQDNAGHYLYYTYDEQPFVPDWKNTKGVFVIKFYAPEALGVGSEIDYSALSVNKLYFATHNTLKIANRHFAIPMVFDMSGRSILVRSFYKGGDTYLNIGGLRRGIYFLRLGEGKHMEVIKLIKVK